MAHPSIPAHGAQYAPARRAGAGFLVSLAIFLAGAGTASAQPAQDPAPQPAPTAGAEGLPGRRISPTRIDSAPIIDGRLDDAIWRDATHITDLYQRRPHDGTPATEASDIFLAYDSANLYLGFHAHYSDPGMLRANRRDRDETFEDDLFLVYFDPFLDQQRAYVFTVNGYGVQGDAILNSRGFGRGREGVPRGDGSWDVLFDTAAEIVDDGFTAEMAIPFKSIRYPQREAGAPHQWGLQIARIIVGKDEVVLWSPISRDVAGFMPQMGVLEGLTDLSRSRNIEILPTFTAIRFGALDSATGAFSDKDPQPEGGVNFKYGVTSNLTADVTLNPDFSQVESDLPQIEVNQRFALFYPELRPFFLEGAEIFDVDGPITAVHTRRIVDPLLGAKLTGKVGRTTVGVMYADDEAPGDVEDPDDPLRGHAAQTFVGRVRYDLYSESHVGAIVTDRELHDSHSRLAGFDSNFRLNDTHSVAFRAMQTAHRDLDGKATEGHLRNAELRMRGRHLRYTVRYFELSPEFRTDVGFVRRTDQRVFGGFGSYNWQPEHWLQRWGPEWTYERNYDFDGARQDETAGGGMNFAFARNSFVATNYDRVLERYEGIDFFKNRFRVFARNDTSRRIGLSFEYRRGEQVYYDPANPYLGHETGVSAYINLRPISRLKSEINIDTNRFTDPRRGGVEVPPIRGADPAGPDHLAVHQPPACPQHQRIQHVRQAVRPQRAVHLPRQRRHGLLRRLRRPLPAGRPDRLGFRPGRDRQPVVLLHRIQADQPGDIPEDAVSVQVLVRRPQGGLCRIAVSRLDQESSTRHRPGFPAASRWKAEPSDWSGRTPPATGRSCSRPPTATERTRASGPTCCTARLRTRTPCAR